MLGSIVGSPYLGELPVFWVPGKEHKLSYYNRKALLSIIYAHYGNLF